ncbi:MAG: hypothetical protein A2074_02015 [Candidatus Aquicultor primus]|uniref:Nudix hydrolase domain-containing protein n=1 Tax=Candidatus Aquicultor primus TaxID=1797195 RepID=A0A1F2ULR4_9ACTN|nr:MAG: hypothetical protein A2074_02015 [Candidatus Aquicultor primus]HCG98725.1 hypothetical protein [Actinomycetota bacterium]
MVTIKVRPAIALIADDKVLLMRYCYDQVDVWGIPGGGVADGETLIDALAREMDEELGVQIEVDGLLCLAETEPAGKVKHTLHSVFYGRVKSGVPALNPVHTTALSLEWVPASEIGRLVLYPPINDTLHSALSEKSEPAYLGVIARPWYG